jgi:broad specificity phosphatase PhoE
MRTLIIIRHSISKIDQNLPPHQWGLTGEGRVRCVPLSEKLTVHDPGIIVASDEPKAEQTGEIVARELGVPLRTAANIHEHRRKGGVIQTREEFFEKIREFFENPARCVFGLESAQQALNRFSVAVKSIMADYPDQNVGLVTHGTVMSLYYGFLTGEDPYQFWCRLGLPAFYTVLWPDGGVSSQVMEIVTTQPEDSGGVLFGGGTPKNTPPSTTTRES